MPFLDNDDDKDGAPSNGLSEEEVRRRNEEVRKLREKHVLEMQSSVQGGLVSRLLEQARQKERESKPIALNNVRAKPLKIDADTYEPPVYKRDTEQKTLLKDMAKKNFILKDFVNTGAKTDIKRLMKAFESVECKKDEEIVTQGEQGNDFYVVESGEVEIQVDDKTVATVGAGSTFGDRNLLYQAPWNVSVRAVGSLPIKVMRLNHKDYRGIMQTTVEAKEEAKKPPPPLPKYVSKKAKEDENAWLQNSKDVKEMKAIQDALNKVSADDLERIKVLGEGQFGEVWLVATDLPGVAKPKGKSKHEFALKIQQVSEDDEPMIRGEIKVMQELSHPFVSTLYTTYEDEDTIDMLLGLIPGGEMWDVIHKENEETGEWLSGIPETHAQFYSMVVADTLSYMHNRQYVFRDLKPENIMVDAKGYPIIVDFGFAKKIQNKTYTFCGTPNYLSPECVKNAGHNAAADWWAFGVVLYEMISGENPFYYDGLEQMELFQCICEDEPEPLREGFSKSVVNLIDKLLIKDQDSRLGSGKRRGKDVLSHPFFNGLNLQRLRLKKIRAPWIPGEDQESGAKAYSAALDKERAKAAEDDDEDAEEQQRIEEEKERKRLEEKKREAKLQKQQEAEIKRLEEELRQEEELRTKKKELELLQEEAERLRKEEEAEKERKRLETERRKKEEEERQHIKLEKERQRREEEERQRLQTEKDKRKAEEEAERERQRIQELQRQREEEEEKERIRQEKKQKAKEEAEQIAKEQTERKRREEEAEQERIRQEMERKAHEAEEAERQRRHEEERLEAERVRKEEEERQEKARKKEERRKQKESDKQRELELEQEKELERQRELEKDEILRKHREETEAATKANKTSKSHDEETELSMDDVFRSSPSRAPGKLDKSWSGFSPSKRTKGRLPDVGSVPDGLVSTLLNEHGKIEKSGDNVYSRRHQEELNKSIGKGLVAQRLAKAKANDSSGVPSMFSYF
jgi:protein kinase A